MTKAEVISAALALPVEVRAELAEELLNSLGDRERAVIEMAWAEESELRIDQLDCGGATLISGESVMANLRDRFR